jgi:hypothetical protein
MVEERIRIKPYPETHQQGFITIEQKLFVGLIKGDFGIQIASDGRVWVCIDGNAVIRFKPNNEWGKDPDRIESRPTVTITKAEYDELCASANDECHDMFNDLCAQYVKEEEEEGGDESNEIASRTYEYRCDKHGTFFDTRHTWEPVTEVGRECVRCPRENCGMSAWIIRPVPDTLTS